MVNKIDTNTQQEDRGENGRSRAVDIAYRAIKDAIMQGELEQGQNLVEADLSEKTGVSRTPVREALKQLRHEGLVVLESYRKNYVASFTEEDLRETIELTALLEGYAASRAALRLSDEQLAELEQLEDQMESLVDIENERDVIEAQWRDLNDKFHALIWAAANGPRTQTLLTSAVEIPFRVLSPVRPQLPKYLERACMYHREIISAFRARDAERAQAQMRAHKLSLITFDVR